ncbi:NAD(P)/FAD-dependent oxidoreductase [Acidicapsa ligni]|uniref:NAD(P)/FAD-dependent oxidoreductase n=1 Tax=Acidicapsa ligni TaxID=542300 RepID=UPI0021DFE327|nr:NAD(P)/FAD-dependent oxidoreductase [Acidicapsa ligni]
MSQLTAESKPEPGRRPRVAIVGGGFAGINAALELGKLPVDVTLIDRRNHHTFQPLLYQVALAVLSPAQIAQPIRTILKKNANTEVLMDEVVSIQTTHETAAGQLTLTSGTILPYDYLILATGATHSYFGRDDWKPFAPGLKTIEDATEIRRRVLLSFELAERHMLEHGWHPPLNFVIIGGGPTGVELAGAVSDIARLYMKMDFRHINPSEARVLVIEGSPRILSSFPPDLSEKAVNQLESLGVEVWTNKHVSEVGPGYVKVGEERIEAVVILWAAGVQASPLGKLLGAPVDKRGGVFVDNQLNPPDLSHVFICGDLAHFEQDGKPVPGVAQPAMQMGRYAAKAIAADLAGKQRGNFRYFDKGDMATIGRLAAVAKIEWPFKAHWGGFMAWATWLLVHIYFLIGFRNRITIFATWAWTYFTFSDGARLITGDQTLPGWKEATMGTANNAIDRAESDPLDAPATEAANRS